MQVKNGAIWAAKPALAELCKEPWPVKTAYRLAKLARKVNEQYGLVETVRNGLITRYGTPQEGGGIGLNRESPNWEQFAAEHDALMLEDCEIDWGPVELPESDIRVTPETLLALDDLVTVG